MRHSRIPQHHQRTITPHTLCTIHTTTILHMNSLSDNLKMSEVTHLGLGNDYAKLLQVYDWLRCTFTQICFVGKNLPWGDVIKAI